MASKGKCCRCRPILPFTRHPFRRKYRRAGKGLGFLVRSIPDSQHFGIHSSAQVKERFTEWNRLAASKFGDKPYKWILICGDIANMYDELDHGGIMPAISWMCDELAGWIGRRKGSVKGLTINMVKNEVVAGHRYEDFDVYISLEELVEISDYDNRHCWLQCRDKVYARLLGVPMGGLLSPHKANGTLGHRESLLLRLLESLGLIGGGVRFMDDVVLALAVSCEKEEVLAEWWIDLVCGSRGYPSPLKLEVEERSSSYKFLELIVSAVGKSLVVEFHSKYETAMKSGAGTYYTRFPSGKDAMTRRERNVYVTGHLHRIIDGAMFGDSIEEAVLLLSKEVVAAGWQVNTVQTALFAMLESDKEVWCKEKLREVLGTFNRMMG